MKKKKVVAQTRTDCLYEFTSISDLVQFLNKTPINKAFENENKMSRAIGAGRTELTRTKSYEEALDFLIHGWDEGTKKLVEKLNITNVNKSKSKRLSVYDVQGYQSCVPRYLQGMPDSMIRQKVVEQKQKVIKIYKNVSYSCKVKAGRILDESRKVLELIQQLEHEGYRVELYVFSYICSKDYYEIPFSMVCSTCIKKSGQRLNLKQIAFPVMHPSFLRRIMLAFIERFEECPGDWTSNYGFPCNDYETLKKYFAGVYVIPSVVEENQITNLEKYKS